MKPLFLVFEGIDGSGKSSAISHMAEYLGDTVLTSAEPTHEGEYGKKIRSILRSGKSLDENLNNELLQYFQKDRLWHVNMVLRPALDEKKTILLDRYFFSTAAYQSFNKDQALSIANEYLGDSRFLQPDFVFYLALAPAKALGRVHSRDGVIELYEKEEQLEKVASHYDYLWQKLDLGARLIRVDAEQNEDQVYQQIKSTVQQALAKT